MAVFLLPGDAFGQGDAAEAGRKTCQVADAARPTETWQV